MAKFIKECPAIYYDIRDETLSKGNYKVSIYCDQNLIGSDSFTLK
jgi:hypothetical protein